MPQLGARREQVEIQPADLRIGDHLVVSPGRTAVVRGVAHFQDGTGVRIADLMWPFTIGRWERVTIWREVPRAEAG